MRGAAGKQRITHSRLAAADMVDGRAGHDCAAFQEKMGRLNTGVEKRHSRYIPVYERFLRVTNITGLSSDLLVATA